MKYIILAISIFLLLGCDYRKVEKGKTPPKSAMKCGAGKCGASMYDTNSTPKKRVAPAMKCGGDMKCGSGKCGAVKIETH